LINPTSVFEQIKNAVSDAVGYSVYVAEIPEDKSLEYYENGLMKPFVVLYFGGPIRASQDHHLNDSSRDTTILYVTVESYAARAWDAVQAKGHLVDVLTHITGDNFTRPVLSGSMSYSRASNTVRPTQYIEAFSIITYSNLSS
jgi:hypothetical protein